MSNELVKYGNQLNSVPFRKFKSHEFNIFFSIVSRMRNKGTSEITFSYSEIKRLSNYKRHDKQNFERDLEKTYHKMLNLNMWYEDEKVYKAWVLFTNFEINKKNQTVTISVNPKLIGVINHLVNWTRFSLEQFVNLQSSYSKTAFRLFKQYRVVGKRKFNIKEFRLLFDVPKSYSFSDINKRILKQLKNELPQYFKNFKITKIKHGRRIVGYLFTWKPEINNQNDFSRGKSRDNQLKIDNINNNTNLTDKEKQQAKDKVLKLQTKDLKRKVNIANNSKKDHSSKTKNVKSILDDISDSLKS
ncbi:hypothetical protein WR164_13760 [Philodulcilactobacillus myokoensis]|uniref:Initiator Rep protein WH1 domain-containing protein n=1 Tax=Philodulcilactobacillus myokoensis TaxID=2929573 RepID=A0A9W6B1Z7_9LACO|nr:RepB family plasmid replication initiator protein [Philodulcilactobacillus myokoensis]GLB47397.1 hypothetical protein WR164_13760 [Philodulcilactobacillus myokoensis]